MVLKCILYGGSFYLSHNLDYVNTLWSEITDNTGILNNEVNPNLWHDVFWKYLSFIDPETAIELYDSFRKESKVWYIRCSNILLDTQYECNG